MLRVSSLLAVAAVLFSLAGCVTLKSWFTPQGQRYARAQVLEKEGHPLGASAEALEALSLEPGFPEARDLLLRTFEPGQAEFRASVDRWSQSKDPDRWDRLVEVYRWQQTLADRGPEVGPVSSSRGAASLKLSVEPVAAELAEARRQASLRHLALGQALLEERPGPRQARKAWSEGLIARDYDPTAPGLELWMAEAREASIQRLMVVPFFLEDSGRLGAFSGPLASAISQRLLGGPGLPERTSVFPSDRLVTLPGGGPARIGLISQPDAMNLAAAAGQNLVLLGQVSRLSYQEPRKIVKTENRERRVVVVSPEHPEGVTVIWKAQVVVTTWTTAATAEVSFAVVEVATGDDLVSAARSARVSDEVTATGFIGDKDALTSEDLSALNAREDLIDADELKARLLASLADQVVEDVRTALR